MRALSPKLDTCHVASKRKSSSERKGAKRTSLHTTWSLFSRFILSLLFSGTAKNRKKRTLNSQKLNDHSCLFSVSNSNSNSNFFYLVLVHDQSLSRFYVRLVQLLVLEQLETDHSQVFSRQSIHPITCFVSVQSETDD
jgi:hypothetical protein